MTQSFRIVVFTLSAAGVSFGQNPDPNEFFEKSIRPIFASQCAGCHNAKLKLGGLDLSTTDGIAAADLVSRQNPAHSRLLSVTGYEEKVRMPPAGKLPPGMLADLRRWVNLGGPIPEQKTAATPAQVFSEAKRNHWSFQPVRQYDPPVVTRTSWVMSPIDRFILAKLEERGIQPPKPAGKLELLRRAKYDLHGLPPSPEEVREFLADESPGAFAKLVDRLLASPRYGEKWGRHWLDVARYAETSGVDENRAYSEAWRYREYVIDAFNRDLPFDRFVMEQIAGDQLPPEPGSEFNARGVVATSFLGLGPRAIVEVDKVKTVYDVIDEQIDTTSKAFLGLTVACARCHDHKFDPIYTKDYYSLAAIFANTKNYEGHDGRDSFLHFEPLVPSSVFARYSAHKAKITAKNMQIAAFIENADFAYAARTMHPRVSDYLLAVWDAEKNGADPAAAARDRNVDAGILRRLIKYLKPNGAFRTHLMRWEEAQAGTVAAIAKEYQERFYIPARRWAAAIADWKSKTEAHIRGEGPLPPRGVQFVRMSFDDPMERFFIELCIPAADREAPGDEDGPFVIARADKEKVLAPELQANIAAMRAELAALEKAAPPTPPMSHGVSDGPPVVQRVFVRGSYQNPGETVGKAFPEIIRNGHAPKNAEGSGRRELAEWLADPANPLTARVIVNRVWGWHFGDGLVRTPNNFGLMGESPTHPELLDYLASEFVRNGWSIKGLHRTMMLSNLYQSSSQITDEAWRADAPNRLWSRFKRRRMDIEEVRDSWLQFSGGLQLRMGGIFDQVEAPDMDRRRSRGGGPGPFDMSKRRSVYLPVNRNAIFTPMVLNDFVDSTTSAGDRPETIVAPQALYLMNNEYVAAQAGAIAKRLLAAPAASERERIGEAYRQIWIREPEAAEVDAAVRYLSKFPEDQNGRGQGWQRFIQVLISANPFHYID